MPGRIGLCPTLSREGQASLPVAEKRAAERAHLGALTLTSHPSPSQACAKRIEGKADAHCTGQFFDMWACIDKCVSSKLFPLLK
jgi:hypothetical protein